MDIVSGTGDVLIGPHWRSLETAGAEAFREVSGEDAIAYAQVTEPIEHRVSVDAGASRGPNGPRTLLLSVFDDADRPLAEAVVGERRTIQFDLPAGRPMRHLMRFRAADPAGTADRSPATVRVFGLRAEPLRPEVVPLRAGFRLGRGGWYTLEEAAGEAFRWVNGGGEILVTRSGARALELDVAPGPALGSKPLTLAVLDGAERLARFVIGARQRVGVELPSARAVPYAIALQAEHRGSALPGHPRTLSFRVFHIPPV